jgi:dTDP-4-dehydrorhamnose 3,5-epimerase
MSAGRFTIHDTPLQGLKEVERKRIGDERGFLSRLYCRDELASAGLVPPIVQINHTATSRRGAIRGLHFQHPPHAEDKYVSVVRGEVFDVAVDLRAGSATFLHWHAARLSVDNGRSLFIPKGFAHGFQTLTDSCELLYLHTAFYNAEAEGALNAFDPALGIDWPLPLTEISVRDRSHVLLDAAFMGIAV